MGVLTLRFNTIRLTLSLLWLINLRNRHCPIAEQRIIPVACVSNHEGTGIFIQCHSHCVRHGIVSGRRSTQRRDQAELTIVEQIQRHLEVHRLVPVLFHFDGLGTGIVGDTSTTNIMQCNGQITVPRLVILILDGELERIGTLQDQRRDAIRPQ